MKKFLRTILMFVLIVGVITVAINVAYIYRLNQNCGTMSDSRNNNSAIKNVPNGIQICNLGSSHGLYSFNYESVTDDYVCFNFGQPSQRLSYDYRILKYYVDSFDEGAVVFIPVSHLSLFGKPETDYDNFEALNKRYYKFLPDELIKEYDAKTDFFVNYAPALATEDIVSLFETLAGKTLDDVWDNTTNAEKAEKFAHGRYVVHVKSKLDENGERWFNQEEIDALYAIIELCRDCGLTPVLVTTPCLSEYNDIVAENDPEFFDDFYGVINEAVKKTGVTYLDYSNDERFVYDYSLYFNTDHLNRKGALLFTNILLDDAMNIKQ